MSGIEDYHRRILEIFGRTFVQERVQAEDHQEIRALINEIRRTGAADSLVNACNYVDPADRDLLLSMAGRVCSGDLNIPRQSVDT